MSRKTKSGKEVSGTRLGITWLFAILSVGLLYIMAKIFAADIISLRPCSANNGTALVNCGKQGLNFGDLIPIVLFILSAALTVSLFTAAWRITRGGSE